MYIIDDNERKLQKEMNPPLPTELGSSQTKHTSLAKTETIYQDTLSPHTPFLHITTVFPFSHY